MPDVPPHVPEPDEGQMKEMMRSYARITVVDRINMHRTNSKRPDCQNIWKYCFFSFEDDTKVTLYGWECHWRHLQAWEMSLEAFFQRKTLSSLDFSRLSLKKHWISLKSMKKHVIFRNFKKSQILWGNDLVEMLHIEPPQVVHRLQKCVLRLF